MNFWPGVITLIKSKAAITGLIGTTPARIYPGVLPQGVTGDALAYRTVSNVGNPTFDGASVIDFMMADFVAYSDTKAGVENLVSVLRNNIEDESGTYSGVQIQNVRYVDSGADDWMDSTKKYSKQIEFQISVKR